MKKGYERLLETWYKNNYQLRYTSKSFIISILTYSLLLIFILFAPTEMVFTEKENSNLNVWLIISIIVIVANLIGLLLFKHAKTIKYGVVVPYFSGLIFLFCPSFVISVATERMEHYWIQCVIILFVTIFSFFYQVIMVNYVETFKSYTKKQYVIHAPAMLIFLPALIIVGGIIITDSPILLNWVGVLTMAGMGTFIFPQFVRIIPYWEAPKEVKSRYDNVLNKLK